MSQKVQRGVYLLNKYSSKEARPLDKDELAALKKRPPGVGRGRDDSDPLIHCRASPGKRALVVGAVFGGLNAAGLAFKIAAGELGVEDMRLAGALLAGVTALATGVGFAGGKMINSRLESAVSKLPKGATRGDLLEEANRLTAARKTAKAAENAPIPSAVPI